jgi:hypothetical protein
VNKPATSRKTFWIAYCVLCVGVAVLGLRSERTIASVLAGAWGDSAGHQSSQATPSATSLQLQVKDSLLVQARIGERDPFKPPVVKRAPTRKRRPAPPKPEPKPSLQTLLFDNVDPSVQLRLGGEPSGWLHVGDKFSGWTVVEITATSATIVKKDQSVVLHSF